MQTLSKSEAAKELLRRRRAKENLIDFTRYTKRDYRPAKHHYLIADALERVERGECKRLMIFMPPRHGKSELASRRFPAWFLGRNPEKSIIAASYNSELATDFGREVRDIVATRHFGNVFKGTKLSASSQAAGRWHTEGGGGYVAAGVGTAITGRGAHILIIDDPLKDRVEADSETTRERVYRWYTSTAYTRLEGEIDTAVFEDDDLWAEFVEEHKLDDEPPFEGAIILIQTRWHEDDLGGRLLDAQSTGGDQWEVLKLAAVNDNDEPLWPEKYPLARLKKIQSAIGARDWSSLYQQDPSPDEGTFFLREWFSRHRDNPTNVNIYITSDYAVSEDKGDFTEHMVWGIDPHDGLFLLDGWYGQKTSDVWVSKLLDLVKRWKPICVFGEAGTIEKAVRPALKKEMISKKVYSRMEWIASVNDKPTRARAFQSRAAMGMVSLPSNEYGDRVLDQLLKFPAGKHDDAVDTCSLIGMVIDQAHPAMVPVSKPTESKGSGYSPIKRKASAGWR